MKRLADKVALVTGAAGGIGSSACRRFAAEGATVVAIDLNQAAGQQVIDEIVEGGGQATFLAADLRQAENVAETVAEAVKLYGRLDVLFNVAGGSGRLFGDGPVHECTPEGWQQTLDLNATSTFLMCKYSLPHLLAAGGGSIINLGSVLGMVGGGPFFATHAYAAAKAAVIGLSRAMAIHYAPDNVRVNVIAPGLIATPMSKRAQAREDIVAYMQHMQPLTGMLGKPLDVAEAAVFFASDESRFITGTVLPVDGGWTAL